MNGLTSIYAEMLEIEDAFKDEHEEDFLYETQDLDFCFEIKGTTGNLKRQHVSRAFDHAQIHADRLDAEAVEKGCKAILIFSAEIEKPLSERAPYPESQVIIAEKTGVAILSAEALLRCYEARVQGKMSVDGFVRLLSNTSGLVQYNCDILSTE